MANPVQSIALVGLLPTPISVLDNWPEMYQQPHAIVVRRATTTHMYSWSSRRERAIVAAARAHWRHGMTQRRITPFEYEYLDGSHIVFRAAAGNAPTRITRKATAATTEVIRVD